jgi:hypothetical protein
MVLPRHYARQTAPAALRHVSCTIATDTHVLLLFRFWKVLSRRARRRRWRRPSRPAPPASWTRCHHMPCNMHTLACAACCGMPHLSGTNPLRAMACRWRTRTAASVDVHVSPTQCQQEQCCRTVFLLTLVQPEGTSADPGFMSNAGGGRGSSRQGQHAGRGRCPAV